MRIVLLTLSFLLTCCSVVIPINEYGPGIYDHDTDGEFLSTLCIVFSFVLSGLCLIASYMQRQKTRLPIILLLCLMVVMLNSFQAVRLYNYYAEQASLVN